jgi:hypothetical protein
MADTRVGITKSVSTAIGDDRLLELLDERGEVLHLEGRVGDERRRTSAPEKPLNAKVVASARA